MPLESVRLRIARKDTKLFVVNDHNDWIVGAALLKTLKEGEEYEIQLLGVSLNYRDNGAGRTLTQHIMKLTADEHPQAKIFVSALRTARYFYKRQNFIPVTEPEIGSPAKLPVTNSTTELLVW